MNATGSHTVYRVDPKTRKVKHYETFKPQTNPYDPKPWNSVKRYDGPGCDPHWNKFLERKISAPHIHDPYYPGSLRSALPWEIPK